MDLRLAFLLTAAFTSFVFLLIWRVSITRSVIHGWKNETADKNIKDPNYILTTFIGTLWCTYGVYLLLGHVDPKDALERLTALLGLWLFVLVGLGMKHYTQMKVPFKIFVFQALGDLFAIMLMGFIVKIH